MTSLIQAPPSSFAQPILTRKTKNCKSETALAFIKLAPSLYLYESCQDGRRTFESDCTFYSWFFLTFLVTQLWEDELLEKDKGMLEEEATLSQRQECLVLESLMSSFGDVSLIFNLITLIAIAASVANFFIVMD